MKTFLLAALLCFAPLTVQGQIVLPATTGLPAPQLSGLGAPSGLYTCNLATNNLEYIQRDANPSQRVWLCLTADGVTYAWDNLKGPIAIATSGTVTTGALLLGGCSPVVTVTMSGATVGTNAVVASPIWTAIPANPGLFNITAWVSAANTVSIQACALATLSSASFTSRVLLY
jgi:hypothetical protein